MSWKPASDQPVVHFQPEPSTPCLDLLGPYSYAVWELMWEYSLPYIWRTAWNAIDKLQTSWRIAIGQDWTALVWETKTNN